MVLMKRIGIIICLALTLACSGKKTCSDGQKKVLNICFNQPPTSADPRRSGDMITSSSSFMLFDGLTNINNEGNVIPALAERYEISADRKTYTFHLRPSQWSDGTPLTAHDFEYSWKSVLAPNFPSPCSFLFYPIENAQSAKEGSVPPCEIGVKALDDYTFEVKLHKPCPYFLKLISFYTFYPVPKHIDTADTDWYLRPGKDTVCNGPFKVIYWNHSNEIAFEANPKHWNSSSRHLDGITASIITDSNTALQMFEQGKFDWIGDPVSPIPIDALEELKKSDCVFSNPIAATVFMPFNTHKFPFNNVNIRKAFSLALDRSSITENIMQMGEQPATRFLPSILASAMQDELLSPTSQHENARMLFNQGCEELGITPEDFPTVRLTAPSMDHYTKIAQAVQQQIQEALPVHIDLDCKALKPVFDDLIKRHFEFGLIMLVAQYQDPMNVFERFMFEMTPKNYPGYENAEYISTIDASFDAPDEEKRNELFCKAEKILAEDMPFTPLFFYNSHSLKKPNIDGIMITAINSLHFRDVEILEK